MAENQLVRDEFSCPLQNSGSIGSEPAHVVDDRVQVGITVTISDVRSVHTARWACAWSTSLVAVVTAVGEVDASNAGALTEYACANVPRARGLILDLSGLDFFGIEGFSALHRVSVSCAEVGIGWAMVSGAAVSRLLRICDPYGSLPVAGSVATALSTLQRPALPREDVPSLVELRWRPGEHQAAFT